MAGGWVIACTSAMDLSGINTSTDEGQIIAGDGELIRSSFGGAVEGLTVAERGSDAVRTQALRLERIFWKLLDIALERDYALRRDVGELAELLGAPIEAQLAIWDEEELERSEDVAEERLPLETLRAVRSQRYRIIALSDGIDVDDGWQDHHAVLGRDRRN